MVLDPPDAVGQLLRLGMEGEFLSSAIDVRVSACEASDAEGELCFGGDCEP